MGVKRYKPYTASRRHMTVSDFNEITKKEPEKSLITRVKNTAGRNAQGKITVRHMGGGSKKIYRSDGKSTDVVALNKLFMGGQQNEQSRHWDSRTRGYG